MYVNDVALTCVVGNDLDKVFITVDINLTSSSPLYSNAAWRLRKSFNRRNPIVWFSDNNFFISFSCFLVIFWISAWKSWPVARVHSWPSYSL